MAAVASDSLPCTVMVYVPAGSMASPSAMARGWVSTTSPSSVVPLTVKR